MSLPTSAAWLISGRLGAEGTPMWRHVIHSWDESPKFEAGRWGAVLCPPGSTPEMLADDRCRVRFDGVPVTFIAVVCPICTAHAQSGHAFEIAYRNHVSARWASRLLSGIWNRFTRAVTREIPVGGGRSFTMCNAHLNGLEIPAGARRVERGRHSS